MVATNPTVRGMDTWPPAKVAALFASGGAIGPFLGVGLSSGDWWPLALYSLGLFAVVFLILFAVASARQR
jgi:hypothetical protein